MGELYAPAWAALPLLEVSWPMLDKAPLLHFGNDPASVKAALEREFTVFEALPAVLAEVWLTPRKPGAWSPAQITEHVIKVNVGMSKTLYLLRRAAPLPEQPRVPGVLVDGRAQAPEFSQPGEGLAWTALEPTWLETKTRFLAEAEQAQVTPASESGRTRFHPYFGDLGALGWTQAAAFHMAHHRKQLRSL